MAELRHLFLVDELREAAMAGDETRLAVVREIIREIKLSQLDRLSIATDDMVFEALERVIKRHERELEISREFLTKALRATK